MDKMTAGKLRIFLADDHAVVREGMKRLIESAPDMEVVGEAGDGGAVLDGVASTRPNIVILDVTMPVLGGIQATRELKKAAPDAKVVALTVHEDGSYLRELMQAGAMGYVLKRAAADELVHAVRAVSTGGVYVDPRMMPKLVTTVLATRGGTAKPRGEITEREEAVMRRIARGYTNKEIAAELGVSVKTVETYKARVKEKLGLRSRVDIVRHANERGWA